MSKRRNQKKWNFDSDGGYGRDGKYFYEHDDRVDNVRRVSFKPNSNRIAKRDRHQGKRLYFGRFDEDVEMAGTSGGGGRNPSSLMSFVRGRGGRNKRQGRNSPPPRFRHGDGTSWFKVTIPYGAKYEKDYLLRLLISHISPTIFIPIAFRTQGNEVSFYVEDCEAANKLSAADRKMTACDGFKIKIFVRPGVPKFELNQALKAKVTAVMSKRYNSETKALDLSKFHMDPDLVQDSFCPLSRNNLMTAVMSIISENIPDMIALNLSENRLQYMDHMSQLSKKAPNLKILHLGKNKIHDLQQLNSIQGLPIVELMLQGNPLCNKIKDHATYVREVRKRFPKLLKLDDIELPPVITFDVLGEPNILPSKVSFLCSPEGEPIVRQFLEQYYSLYDAENRQPLLDAYHQDAYFSLSTAFIAVDNSANSPRTVPFAKLHDYLPESRNHLKVTSYEKRQKLLRSGKLAIVTFLSQLPSSQHDPMSFAVDVPIFTAQLIYISVHGLFKETKTAKQPIRAFQRLFVLVPAGNGFCIVNDQFFVTNPTSKQERAAFNVSPVVPVQAEPPIPAAVSVPVPVAMEGEALREQMVQTMSLQSGMNQDWSRKCLAETDWNFERAMFVFSELHKQGTIPAEAFMK